MDNNKKDNFILYHNLFPMIEELENEDVGDVLKSIFRYSMNGEIENYPKGSGKSLLFKAIKNSIDINNKKYIERCENNRRNARKKWKKIFYDNDTFTIETFKNYCEENDLQEDFDEILQKQVEYVNNQKYEKLKEDYNCPLASNENILKAFS